MPVYRVESRDGLETVIHRPFVGLPNVQQAADAVFRETALAKVNRPLGDESISVTIIATSDSATKPD